MLAAVSKRFRNQRARCFRARKRKPYNLNILSKLMRTICVSKVTDKLTAMTQTHPRYRMRGLALAGRTRSRTRRRKRAATKSSYVNQTKSQDCRECGLRRESHRHLYRGRQNSLRSKTQRAEMRITTLIVSWRQGPRDRK